MSDVHVVADSIVWCSWSLRRFVFCMKTLESAISLVICQIWRATLFWLIFVFSNTNLSCDKLLSDSVLSKRHSNVNLCNLIFTIHKHVAVYYHFHVFVLYVTVKNLCECIFNTANFEYSISNTVCSFYFVASISSLLLIECCNCTVDCNTVLIPLNLWHPVSSSVHCFLFIDTNSCFALLQ